MMKTEEIIILCSKPGFGGLLMDGIQENEKRLGTKYIILCSLEDPYGFYRKFGWVDMSTSFCEYEFGFDYCPEDEDNGCSYMIKKYTKSR